jgi:hypothetical protein
MAAADIIFADPPYVREGEYEAFFEALRTGTRALTVVQHSVRLVLEEKYGAMRRTRHFRQGDNALSFYEIIP